MVGPGPGRRALLRGVGGLSVGLGLGGCVWREVTGGADAADEPSRRGGRITLGSVGAFEALAPLAVESVPTGVLVDLCYAPGVLVEPSGFQTVPWSFADWERLGEGERVGVDLAELTWSDDEPLTPGDVGFTYGTLAEHRPARYRSVADRVLGVEGSDDWDLELVFDEPVGVLADPFSVPILPEHVHADLEDPIGDVPDEPITLGPADVDAFEPEVGIDLTFREEWPPLDAGWAETYEMRGGPFLDEVRFRVHDTASEVVAAVEQGAVDAGAFDLGPVALSGEGGSTAVATGPDDGFEALAFNTRVEPFDDQSFRQALSMLLDRERWVSRYRGFADPGSTLLPPAYPHLRPEAAAGEEPNEHPAMAALWERDALTPVREFLESGGTVTGEAGEYAGREVAESATGVETTQDEARHEYAFVETLTDSLIEAGVARELTIEEELVTERLGRPVSVLAPPVESASPLAEVTHRFAERLREFGVPVEVEVTGTAEIGERAFEDGDFDVCPLAWRGCSPHGVRTLSTLLHSGNTVEEGDGDGPWFNLTGYGLDEASADDELDDLRRERDDEARIEGVRALSERLYLEAPIAVVGYRIAAWPIDTTSFEGIVSDVVAPGGSSLPIQLLALRWER
ncbi:ABC transporter substrate-binding protein [Natronorarus salvus]|uniref:ABC transporter substrate-binding protein n=1 Tax=Natronorarus salvus TaxID=3117733 RepID=UPI002F26AFAE